MFNLDSTLLRQAAILRGSYGLKLGQCDTFLTNDRRLPNIPKLKILQLDNYI